MPNEASGGETPVSKKFQKDLESILAGMDCQFAGDSRDSIFLTTPQKNLRKAIRRLYEAGIPIKSVTKYGEPANLTLDYPIKYLVPQKSQEELLALKTKIISTMSYFADALSSIPKYLAREERSLYHYTEKMLEQLKAKRMPMKEKKDKISRLEALTADIAKKEPNNQELKNLILNKTFLDYALEVISKDDDYTKVSGMAKVTKICWDTDERAVYSKEVLNDFVKNGGTLVYLIYPREQFTYKTNKNFFKKLYKDLWGKRYQRWTDATLAALDGGAANKPKIEPPTAVFGRNFIVFDKKGKSHLFIDLLEGASGDTTYIHDFDVWSKDGDIGAFKFGILFNLLLAKRLGVDYITGGDPGVAALFRELGASEIKLSFETEVGMRFYKLGNSTGPPYLDKDAKNLVKSYFLDSEKYYALQVDKLV